MFYAQLSEGEFIAAAATSMPKDFSYEYVEQMGLALVDDAHPERRERGMGYMRIAGRGVSELGPGIYVKHGDVEVNHSHRGNARKAYESAKQVGMMGGRRNLARDQRACYYDALRWLAARAEVQGDVPHAAAEAAKERGDMATMAAKDAEADPHFEDAVEDLK